MMHFYGPGTSSISGLFLEILLILLIVGLAIALLSRSGFVSSGSDERLARIEKDMEEIKKTVEDIKDKLEEI
jgi:hypothetical protein